jgi:chromosome segregation ATPase
MEEFKRNADRIISEISERKHKLSLIDSEIYSLKETLIRLKAEIQGIETQIQIKEDYRNMISNEISNLETNFIGYYQNIQ